MAKSQVAIATDSTAYIPPELLKEHNIHVIPLCLNWEGESYLDNVDITPDEFYLRLGDSKELPTTSQPSAGEFHEFYKKIAETSESIVGVYISEKLSGTVDSAVTAADMMPDFPIEVINSKTTSMALGYLALQAARLAEQGSSQKEITQAVREMVPSTKVIFVLETLEFLHRGGRIGGANRLLGSMLSIKPVLHLEDGGVEPLAKIRTKSKAIEFMLDDVAENIQGKGPLHATVIHASTPSEAEKFRDQVNERFSPVELMISDLSPVIGTHLGPGLVGLAYYAEPK